MLLYVALLPPEEKLHESRDLEETGTEAAICTPYMGVMVEYKREARNIIYKVRRNSAKVSLNIME